VPQIIVALAIAAVLDTNLRGKTFWRMGVLLPYIVMPVAVSLIFSNMYGDKYGLVNTLLAHVGIPGIPWHSNPLASQFAIATMVNFRWTGYNALILLAGMQAIPRDYYEAATIDGAGAVRRFFSITIPQLRPTLIFVIITATIGGLQIFDEPRLFDQYGTGGANSQWLTLTIYLYNLGWGQLDFGRAAAVAWLLFLVIVLIGLVNLGITRRIASNEGRRS
jgi:cellobiose transport system permease protein